jgi:glycine cleavage system H protein
VDLPEKLRYTESHEWVADNGDGTVTVGITAVATEQLGDLVYVELPQVGTSVARGANCAIVESTKAASEVYAPVAGEVLAANADLAKNPERVNQSPYKDGWLFKLKVSDRAELDGLLARDAYAKSAGV